MPAPAKLRAATGSPTAAGGRARGLPLVGPGMARQLVREADDYEEKRYRIRHLTDLGPKEDAAGSDAPDEEQVS